MNSLHPVSFLVEGFRVLRVCEGKAPDGAPAIVFYFTGGLRLAVFVDAASPLGLSVDYGIAPPQPQPGEDEP